MSKENLLEQKIFRHQAQQFSTPKPKQPLYKGKKGNNMKKALIICVGGMSSSMIAKKTTEELKKRGFDYVVEATGVIEGDDMIRQKAYDLFLVSPQTKMYLKKFQDAGKEAGVSVVPIPPQAYIPVPMGITKMADLVSKEI